jgi:hypothetical protein
MAVSPPTASTFPDPPTLTPSNATVPPTLPSTWRAVALLTPWDDAQLVVATADTDSVNGTMRVRAIGLEYGYLDLLFTKTGAYLVHTKAIGGEAPDRLIGPIATNTVVPATGWLAGAGLTCAGIGDALEASSSWWLGETTCQNGYVNGPPPPTPAKAGNIFNFHADTGYPWRFIFVNPTNDYRLPVLGAYPIVHLPTFGPLPSEGQAELERLVGLAATATAPDGSVDVDTAADLENQLAGSAERMSDADVGICKKLIATLIPGLTAGPKSGTLPFWPDRLFLTSFSNPTGQMPGAPPPRPIPTQVFYDWPKREMLTRLWVAPDTYEDAILDSESTHVVLRKPDGTHACVKTLPVGLVKPKWASADMGAHCRAVITNNPQLSPNRTTNVCVMPSRPGQVFWTWYTNRDQAVMFIEVPQACDVMLLLTDYADWDPTPAAFDPSLFVVPPDCLTSPTTAPGAPGAPAAVPSSYATSGSGDTRPA